MFVAFLTTEDNPYDPCDEFDDWYGYDVYQGYNTCSYVARIARTSDELSDAEYNQAVEAAIDEILELNLTGNYKKIIKEIKE